MKSQDESEQKEWVGDKLGRKKDADFLTNYLIGKFENSRKEESFVLNLNAEWGYGKTFFLKKWEEDLKSQGFPVIYYDAWRADFSSEPLLSFISEFYTQLLPFLGDVEKIKSSLQGFFKAALTYRKPVLNSLIKRYVGSTPDELTEKVELPESSEEASGGDTGSQLVTSFVDNTIDKLLKDHEEKKHSIEVFKEKIEKVAKHIKEEVKGKRLPIFVFVDELDRCRPTYSIELLENIKHLFLSDSICFVVSTDSDQLCKSIKAVYGGEFDSERYLNRFFDHEYVIPEPDNVKFSEFLCGEYGLEDERMFTPLSRVSETFSVLSDYFRLTLREQHHAASMLEAIKVSQLDSSSKDFDVFYLLFLIMLKITKPSAYKDYSLGEKTTEFIKTITLSENRYDQGVEVPTKIRSRGGSSTDKMRPLWQVVSKYVSYYEVNLIDDSWYHENETDSIYRKLRDRFSSQAPREWTRGSFVSPDVCGYIKMVNQVGQLS